MFKEAGTGLLKHHNLQIKIAIIFNAGIGRDQINRCPSAAFFLKELNHSLLILIHLPYLRGDILAFNAVQPVPGNLSGLIPKRISPSVWERG